MYNPHLPVYTLLSLGFTGWIEKHAQQMKINSEATTHTALLDKSDHKGAEIMYYYH